MSFRLTPHEVMRGLKLRQGRLVLRPSGLLLLGSVLDALVALVVALVTFVRGGAWVVVALLAVAAFCDAVQRTRVGVVATKDRVVVRNRWRRYRIQINDVTNGRVETVEWLLRQPVYVFVGWWPGREWLIGVVHTSLGRHVRCDSLISVPGDEQTGPTPAETKIDALNRWLGEHRTG